MHASSISLNEPQAAALIEGVEDRSPVSGLTHTFYNYPARFSPSFARAAIKAFTEPDDLVFDPFMGGGTSLVEACSLHRHSIGTDISALATFVSKVKTTILFDHDIEVLRGWGEEVVQNLNLHRAPIRPFDWIELGYQKNINDKYTWPIRKIIELALAQLDRLHKVRQRQFARCAILKTAQWALDRRSDVPSAGSFRKQFQLSLEKMLEGAVDFANTVRPGSPEAYCLNRSVIGVDEDNDIQRMPAPKLILTSPPYPGVHVLYHRWQVKSTRETPAPFWIADCLDGDGSAYYTFGDRKQQQLDGYYNQLSAAFGSLARISNEDTLIVQMVAFSNPSWQLTRYLQVMQEAGLREVIMPQIANGADGRVWREVPNRKWYARNRGETSSSKEVVLFHRKADNPR
jgi:hypothetical protein